jgi:Domain of unknown function (DUF6602)
MQFLKALRNSVARVSAGLEDSRLFEHKGDRGEFRERVISEFLRPFLPACFGIGSGAAFDMSGASSKQLDIVLYDALFSIVLFRDGENSLFPCESVFGNIEVKSHLSVPELSGAIENIRSLKKLSRANSDMCDVLPFRRLGLAPPLTFDPSVRNPYLGIVFGYAGATMEALLEVLNSLVRQADSGSDQTLPDYVFNFERGYTILRVASTAGKGVPAPHGQPYSNFAGVNTGTDTLVLFYLTVNALLDHIILRGPNLEAYWISVLNGALTQATDSSAAT